MDALLYALITTLITDITVTQQFVQNQVDNETTERSSYLTVLKQISNHIHILRYSGFQYSVLKQSWSQMVTVEHLQSLSDNYASTLSGTTLDDYKNLINMSKIFDKYTELWQKYPPYLESIKPPYMP